MVTLAFCLSALALCSLVSAQTYTVRATPTQPLMANTSAAVQLQVLSDDVALQWSQLNTIAERRLHIVAVHEKLGALLHVHPEDFPPVDPLSFTISPNFPFAGTYIIGYDFLPSTMAANPGMDMPSVETSSTLNVNGRAAPDGQTVPSNTSAVLIKGVPIESGDRLTSAMIYQALLVPPGHTPAYLINATFLAEGQRIQAGTCVLLKFQFFRSNGTSPSPITDLQTYLGADSHIAIVKDDLSEISHQHGYKIQPSMTSMPCGGGQMAPSSANSSIVGLATIFASPGKYRVFVQTKADGMMIAPSFQVNVEGEPNTSAASNGMILPAFAALLAILLLALEISW